MRIEIQQFRRRVANLCSGAAPGLFPLPAAQLVQRRRVFRSAAVTADHRQLRDRDIQLVAGLVFECQEFGFPITKVHGGETEVAADAMLRMHDRVTDLDLGKIAQHAFGGGAAIARRARAHLRRIELVLGDDRDAGVDIDETRVQGAYRQHQRFGRLPEGGPGFADHRPHLILVQQSEHRLAASQAFGDQQHASREAFAERSQCEKRIGRTAIDPYRRQCICRPR